jgi:hypothetical protein
LFFFWTQDFDQKKRKEKKERKRKETEKKEFTNITFPDLLLFGLSFLAKWIRYWFEKLKKRKLLDSQRENANPDLQD